MSKLNPEDLQVTSFDTSAEYAEYVIVRPVTFTDPTAETRCFVCPVYSENCY